MMVKKKRADKEEASQENHTETPDYEEYNYPVRNSGNGDSEDNAEVNNDDNLIKDEGSETVSSDKVVDREKELQEKLAEIQDKYIRLSAEFDNYRKRTLREKMELSKYASKDVLLKLLPVMDDFDRAVSNMESSEDYTAIKNGVDLIYVKLSDFLKQNGLREIDALNCPFNVDLHDAVAKVAVDEEDKKGKIIDVILKGYYLQDKVIRHAKVVVGE
ncbi:MAG: nucleotide exchange factor GrpE [Bacteroidales bacterium]